MYLSGQRSTNEMLHSSKYYNCVLKLSTPVGFSEQKTFFKHNTVVQYVNQKTQTNDIPN